METILKKDKYFRKGAKTTTKMINSFSELKYKTRFKKLGLTTLERRRLRGDLIEVCVSFTIIGQP